MLSCSAARDWPIRVVSHDPRATPQRDLPRVSDGKPIPNEPTTELDDRRTTQVTTLSADTAPEVWFLTGSQSLYGEETLRQVAAQSQVIAKALEDLKKSKPDLVAVSAGFDAYARDPIAQETLEAEDFHWIGEQIRKLGVTAFSALEGGYSDDLPELILAYLKGLEGK